MSSGHKSAVSGVIDGYIEGAWLGSQVRIRNLENDVAQWSAAAKRIDGALQEAKADTVYFAAARDGWRALSKGIVAELKDPTTPRHLSDPNNDAAREAFKEAEKEKAEKEWTKKVYGDKPPPVRK